MTNTQNYREIKIELLQPFSNHPFSQYEGQQLDDMIESIRANGVLTPVIVRPAPNGKYEILSGHNRTNAAKQAGLIAIPAVIREDLTYDEALLVVTETNLIQRSFTDMKHSERAIVISTHYDAIKKKSGYRTDLLEDIEQMTSSPVAKRSRFTMNKLGEQYGLSKDTIARYLRINKLITPLKKRLDNKEFSVRAAVSLSYLRQHEQSLVDGVFNEGKKINTTQAGILRIESQKGKLNRELLQIIFEPIFAPRKTKPIPINRGIIEQYFGKNQDQIEIERVIDEALKQYFNNNPKKK